MRLSLALLFLATPLVAQNPYQATIDRWKAQDALNPPPPNSVLFVGSSSIRLWEHLARDFAAWDTIQRGFGGSTFADLNLFVDDIVLPYDPAAIVVFEGTNDVAGGLSAAQVFQNWQSFVQLVHTGQNPSRPPIPIFFIGITPTPSRWPLWPIASAVNALIEAQAATDPALHYLDTPTPFLATGGPPALHLFQSDLLHLTEAGYDIWTSVIRPDLAAEVEPPSSSTGPEPRLEIGERLLFDFGPSNPLDGTWTESPDRFGNHWNNWHEVIGGANILAGEHIGGLVTTAGQPTGIDLVISGELLSNGLRNGGLTEPRAALLGDFAVGTATQDYFFSDGFPHSGGFYLRGLDPERSYDLRLFGTRITTSTRISRYTWVGNGTRTATLQTSGTGIGSAPGLNGNDDEIRILRGLSPTPNGKLFLDLSRVTGAYAYLGILELSVRPGRDAASPAPSTGG